MDEYSLPTELDESASIWNRVLRRTILVFIVIVTTVAMVAMVMMFRKISQQPGVAATSERQNKFNQDRYRDLDTRQLLRCGLHEVDQQAELIWDEIGVLENEIDAYKRQFNDLKTSDTGRRLVKDSWTVRYFVDKQGEPLPSDKVAKHCRIQLNELMLTVQEALSDSESGYAVSKDTRDHIDLIAFRVHRARREYTRHHLLLVALEEEIAGGKSVTPETLEEAAEQLRNEMILNEWGHPLAQHRNAKKTSKKASAAGGIASENDTDAARSESSKLRRAVGRSQATLEDDFDTTILIGDEIRE